MNDTETKIDAHIKETLATSRRREKSGVVFFSSFLSIDSSCSLFPRCLPRLDVPGLGVVWPRQADRCVWGGRGGRWLCVSGSLVTQPLLGPRASSLLFLMLLMMLMLMLLFYKASLVWSWEHPQDGWTRVWLARSNASCAQGRTIGAVCAMLCYAMGLPHVARRSLFVPVWIPEREKGNLAQVAEALSSFDVGIDLGASGHKVEGAS